MVHQKS
jgi:hypothetical protein